MEYRSLGGTGVRVSHLCLGAMMFGAWGNTDHEESVRIIHAALDAGVNFVDTADVYSHGEAEEIVAKALKGRRDNVVLATKFHASMGEDPNMRGNARRWIHRACDASLRRLGTDWIDIYQAHRHDPETDLDDTLGAVTSAIIGPRTMEQLADLLAGQDVVLDEATLDRIDELVPPGTNVHQGDAGWTSPALAPAARRR